MNFITISGKQKFTYHPLIEKANHFSSITWEEGLGDIRPHGELVVRTTNEFLDIKGTTQLIKIVQDDGVLDEFKVIIYASNFDGINQTLKFILLPEKFTQVKSVRYFDGIESCIKLYPGKIFNNTSSDINNRIRIHQKNESDYNFLRRILKTYKKDTIFAFTSKGLIIKDLKKFKPEYELRTENTTDIYFPNNKLTKIPVIKGYSGKQLECIIHNNKKYICHKEYDQVISNLFDNMKYYTQGLTEIPFKFRELRQEYVGAFIKLNSEKYNLNRSIVSYKKVIIDKGSVQVDLKVKSFK